MTVETETLILKAIEKLDQKLDNFIGTSNQKFDDVNTSLTSIQVNQAKLEGKVETLAVEIQNIKEDVKEIKTELKETKEQLGSEIKEVRTELKETKEQLGSEIKEVRIELKETRNEVSGLYKWVIGLILSVIIGGGAIIFRVFDLFPKA